MSHWWSSKQELILLQMWVVLILSHIVYALRELIATAATCEPCEVSVPLLVELLPKLCSNSEFRLERLVQEGRQLGLLRESTSRTHRAPGRAFTLPVSSARSAQAAAGACPSCSTRACA